MQEGEEEKKRGQEEENSSLQKLKWGEKNPRDDNNSKWGASSVLSLSLE